MAPITSKGRTAGINNVYFFNYYGFLFGGFMFNGKKKRFTFIAVLTTILFSFFPLRAMQYSNNTSVTGSAALYQEVFKSFSSSEDFGLPAEISKHIALYFLSAIVESFDIPYRLAGHSEEHNNSNYCYNGYKIDSSEFLKSIKQLRQLFGRELSIIALKARMAEKGNSFHHLLCALDLKFLNEACSLGYRDDVMVVIYTVEEEGLWANEISFLTPTVLCQAAFAGHIDFVNACIVAYGQKVSAPFKLGHNEAFTTLVSQGNTKMIKLIIDQDPSLILGDQTFYTDNNVTLSDYLTQLHTAAYYGQVAIVRMFIEALKEKAFKAIALHSFDGKTILHIAAEKGHKEIVEELIAAITAYAKADPDNRNIEAWRLITRWREDEKIYSSIYECGAGVGEAWRLAHDKGYKEIGKIIWAARSQFDPNAKKEKSSCILQ